MAHPNHAGQTNYADHIAETAAEVLGVLVQVDPPVPVGPTTTTPAAISGPTTTAVAPVAAAPTARPVAVTPTFTG